MNAAGSGCSISSEGDNVLGKDLRVNKRTKATPEPGPRYCGPMSTSKWSNLVEDGNGSGEWVMIKCWSKRLKKGPPWKQIWLDVNHII